MSLVRAYETKLEILNEGGLVAYRHDERGQMSQRSLPSKPPAEAVVRDIRRAAWRHDAAADKIRIMLECRRGEHSIAELCRREGIAEGMYDSCQRSEEANASCIDASFVIHGVRLWISIVTVLTPMGS